MAAPVVLVVLVTLCLLTTNLLLTAFHCFVSAVEQHQHRNLSLAGGQS